MLQCSDFLKMVMYHNCGGERLGQLHRQCRRKHLRRRPAAGACSTSTIACWITSREAAGRYSQNGTLRGLCLPRDETGESSAERGTKTLLWPGIDIDIPTAAQVRKYARGTKAAVAAAFKGGADGVLLSRKYSEMKLANLRGAGDAARELRLA